MAFPILFIALPIAIGLGIGGFMAFSRTVPSIADLRSEITPPSTKVYAEGDVLIGEFKVRKGKYISYDKMPPNLINAVVAVEDSHFWRHSGVDYLAILRAALTDIKEGRIEQGGSTITQQLAKIAFLSSERTFTRKLKEFVLAGRIESKLSKEEIMELYLNRAYFGQGAYGVEMASEEYFGKPARELELPEAAMIAGLLKAPSAYSPVRSIEKAKRRQQLVLARMEEEGFLTPQEREAAEAAEVVLDLPAAEAKSVNYFLDYVRKGLIEEFGEEAVYNSGLKVYTTLDLGAQEAAVLAVQRGLREHEKRRGWRGPIAHDDPSEIDGSGRTQVRMTLPSPGDAMEAHVIEVSPKRAILVAGSTRGELQIADAMWASRAYDTETGRATTIKRFDLTKILAPGDLVLVGVKAIRPGGRVSFTLEQEPEAQGALVAMETGSGFLRALVGGYDFYKSEYNRAILSRRQAGSAYKPVIYALAMQYGYTPATIMKDEEIKYETRMGKDEDDLVWNPRNYDGEYGGAMSLRTALAKSRNVISVKLVDELGIQRVHDFSRSMGLTEDLPRDLTIALGSLTVTPLNLTVLYGVFANGGVRIEPISIKYVTDIKGRVIKSYHAVERRVMDPQTAYLTTSMLESVVREGTGWKARQLGRPSAGKTGTTNEYRDAWYLGYTPDMVAGVWVGFDDVRTLGNTETGSTAAAPIWVHFMERVNRGIEPRDFPVPDGIVTVRIDPGTGLLANEWTEGAYMEVFKAGTEPKESAPSIWNVEKPAEGSLF